MRIGLLLLLLLARGSASPLGPLPIASLAPFSAARTSELLAEYGACPVNHEHEGMSARIHPLDEPPASFKQLRRTIPLGKGSGIFASFSKRVLDLSLASVGWVRLCTVPRPTVGSPLASVSRVFGLLYTFNPCRIVSMMDSSAVLYEGRPSRVSQVCFSTVRGHLIAGEERFRVVHDLTSDKVSLELYSFTRGDGLTGAIAMLVVRPLQRRFFGDITRAVLGQLE